MSAKLKKIPFNVTKADITTTDSEVINPDPGLDQEYVIEVISVTNRSLTVGTVIRIESYSQVLDVSKTLWYIGAPIGNNTKDIVFPNGLKVERGCKIQITALDSGADVILTVAGYLQNVLV